MGKPCSPLAESQGLRFIAANARERGGEIDLIMRDGAVTVFVEVRYRRSALYGDAAASVTPQKQQRLLKAARLWLCRQNGSFETVDCRFDVVAFTGNDIQWLKTPLANSVIPEVRDPVLDRIKACFTESIQTQIAAAEALPDAISRAAMTLVQSLLNGNKILCCGNGTSAANAQHFAASMINRFETERPGLPAIALNTDNVVLTAIANDRLHDEIYAKQVRALGHAGDVLLAISTRGNSRDIVKAVEAAVTRDMTIVALTGYDGGELAGLLGQQDVEIRIPSHRSARIQEMHMLTVNCLCDLIDNTLFPHQDD
jgi:DnaA initiator-associating protein